ncbi:hypothetical protein GCM10020255_052600 [Rhodococcus baikonurensis]
MSNDERLGICRNVDARVDLHLDVGVSITRFDLGHLADVDTEHSHDVALVQTGGRDEVRGDLGLAQAWDEEVCRAGDEQRDQHTRSDQHPLLAWVGGALWIL